MARKLKLAFGIHLHQPAGNFLKVFEENYESAYLPFLKVFRNFKSLKLIFHSSGILLRYLLNKEEFSDILSSLVEENRLEVLTGGFYEPIFPAIFERDGIFQIEKLTELIEKKINYKPEGLWLAERVWEPHIISSIKKAGVKYLLLDDYHILSSGVSQKNLDGYFISEDVEDFIGVFPIDEKMRYLTPWAVIEKVEEYLRSQFEKGRKLIVVVDDGEKFGGWPETYKWVYEERWLEKFFEMVERNGDWLESTTLSDYFAENDFTDKVIIPSNSYIEMGEWALPPESAVKYGELREKLKSDNFYEENKIFLKGTLWRNFLAKYKESGLLNKFGNFLSKELEREKVADEDVIDSLLESQCNDVYWHGVFGGIYLPHLRENAYKKLKEPLLKLDNLWRAKGLSPGIKEYDIDLDSKNEILVNGEKSFIIIKPREGSIPLFYFKECGINIFDVVMRYRERYHIKSLTDGVVLLGDGKKLEIPEMMGFDESPRWGNRKMLVENVIFPDGLIKGEFSYDPVIYVKSEVFENSKFFILNFEGEKIKEEIKVSRDGSYFVSTVKNNTRKRVAVSFDISTLTYRDIEKWISIDDGEKFGVGEKRFFDGVRDILLSDLRRGFRVFINSNSSFSLSIYPVITYSLDVDRIEATFQGTNLTLFFREPEFSYRFLVERV